MSATFVPVLVGKRITLRRATDDDVKARLALGNDPDICEMFGMSRDAVRPATQQGAERWVRRLIEHPQAWVIDFRSMIGEIRLDGVDPQDRRASLAIGILDPAALGIGLGTEAVRLVLLHAFGELQLHRISLRVLSYNERAIRAYQKCGFVIEGRERESAFVNGSWHDDLIMGALASDHRSSDASP